MRIPLKIFLKNLRAKIKTRLNNLKAKYKSQNPKRIKEIWCNKYPTGLVYKLSWFEKLVYTLFLLGRCISLGEIKYFWLTKEKRTQHNELYVLVWIIVLVVLLFFRSEPKWYGWIIGYRLLDIIIFHLCIIFVDSYGEDWSLRSVNRSILFLMVNYIELILGFGALYRWTGSICKNGLVLTSPCDAFYFSVVTISTLGFGEFTPQNHMGKLLVSIEAFIGFIFVVIVVARFLTFKSPRKGGKKKVRWKIS